MHVYVCVYSIECPSVDISQIQNYDKPANCELNSASRGCCIYNRNYNIVST